jgi:hypothetical protein
MDDGQHLLEVELLDAPVRLSCRFTLCHPPSVDAAFLGFVRELMVNLGMEAKICDDVRPEHAQAFSLDRYAEFSAVTSGYLAARRAEWITAFGTKQLAATTNEVYERIILPQCQPVTAPPILLEMTCPLCGRWFVAEVTLPKYAPEERGSVAARCPHCQAECSVEIPTAGLVPQQAAQVPLTKGGQAGGMPVRVPVTAAPSPGHQLRSLPRYADVNLPREAAVGVPVALLVRVTVKPVSPDAKKLELRVPKGERVVEVTVVVRTDGLELKGSNLQKLRVPLTADSDPACFELVGRQLGPASVTVDFFQQERYLGSVTAQTWVKEASALKHAGPAATRGRLDFSEQWPALDLLVRIYQTRAPDGTPRFRFELTSAKLGLFCKDAGEVGLPQQPQAWVEQQMRVLNGLAGSLSQASDAVLARFGVDLYDRLCPPELKNFYWEQLHERDDLQTVLLVSDEPWVCWEMLRPWRTVGQRNVEGPHWCERFLLGRWLGGQPPPVVLPRGKVAAIAPRDAGLSGEDEVKMLGRLGLPVERVPARLHDVLKFLASDGCAGLHVVSEGVFNAQDADLAELWLEKPTPAAEREVLYPRLVNGACLNFGGPRPLVFLNACASGRSAFTYWGLGGWARAFVERAGCGAFLAPFWEIEDTRARHFAEAFYTLLLQGKPLGEALRSARLALKGQNNPTWLAYGLYGHPRAFLKRS